MADPMDERATAGTDPWVRRLTALPEAGRLGAALDLVRAKTAELLGMEPDEVRPDLAYRDFGANSLAAVALTGSLGAATGLELPLTLLFDHPTPAAVARHLLTLLGLDAVSAVPDEARAAGPPQDDEPIAVIGMACRYPGGVTSPDGLWDVVAAGRDVVSDFPADRGWDLEGLFSDDPETAGTSYARTGGFLDSAASFDAGFFGIARREALAMDPQQRLLLMTAWESLEDAGIDPGTLRTSPTGVYIGSSGQDYEQVARAGSHDLEGYWGIGSAGSILSGRVAYALGFEGPALTVDTACSSSLVSVHLAVQALRRGECGLALAGGAAVMTTPKVFTEFSRQRALSPDGRCRSYAAAADGTGWAEGVGLLVLERLGEARRKGHRVLALIPGSAVNQDGASNGLTAPNGASQRRVLRQALTAAGLRPRDIDAVEGHGTGTTLGDPIEIDALAAVFAADRPAGQPLRLGSLKSNIGHSQAAAGVGGLIKMIMALWRGELPRTLHVDQPTPKADWTSGAVTLLTEATPWPRGPRVRRAGVSAFGVGGTNAHVVVAEAPLPDTSAEVPVPAGPPVMPWVVSARTPAALRDQARRLTEHLTARPDAPHGAVAAALALTRAPLEHRAAVTGGTRAELLDALAAVARGESCDRAAVARARTGGKVVFVFPGQGSQWAGMGLELAAAHPVFAEELRACADALAPHVDWSLDEVLRGAPGAPPLDRVDVVQPALFAVMAALAALWRHHGVRPDAVVGHSQGEIVAAYVAGGLSLDDAALAVALRSRAIATLAGRGGMASVTAAPDRLLPLLAQWEGRISVAAVNGPSSMTVSGDPGALDELLAVCAAEDIWARRVPVDYASHSPQVESVEADLIEALAPLSPRSGEIPFHSGVTGAAFDTAGLDAGYWYRNLRRTVRFEEVVRELLALGHTTFVEVSPHPILTFALEQTVEAARPGPHSGPAAAVFGSARRDGELARYTAALGDAWVHGAPVDWATPAGPGAARHVTLPTYAFQAERYWASPRAATGDLTGAGLRTTGHPLLAAATELAGGAGWLFTSRVSRTTHTWLDDHAVHGTVLLPGTAFADLAARAAAEAGCDVVDELTLEEPLVFPDGGAVDVQTAVGAPDTAGRRSIAVHSRATGAPDGPWTRHATGSLSAAPPPAPPPAAPAPWPPPGAVPLPIDGLYDRLADRGFGYGPAFRGLRAAWRHGDTLLAEVETAADAAGFGLHPALLDAAFHAQLTDLSGAHAESGGAWLPFAWSGVRIIRPGATRLRVTLTPEGEGAVRMSATDDTGASTVTVASVVARPISPTKLASARSVTETLFRLEWQPATLPEPPLPAEGRWAVLGTDSPDTAQHIPGAAEESDVPAGGGSGDLFARLGGSAPVAVSRYAGLSALAASLDAGHPVPDVALVPVPVPTGDLDAGQVREAVRLGLDLLQGWLRDGRFAEARLVFVTRGAVAAGPGDVGGPGLAALWGLVRAAQAEHPGRFALVDLGEPGDAAALGGLVASGEPQAAVRGGRALVPRVVRARTGGEPLAFDPAGTVLVTGGTSGIGAQVARHLAVRYGARHLLLAGRRGPAADGARELAAELTALGTHVTVAACDFADRDATAALVASVPGNRPLTAVVHSAGVLDDGLVEALTPERLDRVLRPKADAVLNLHEATAGAPLDAFVLFSSVAGTVGGPGQANYAAANTFLDAFARWRRAKGLPAVSLAWGLWGEASGMTRHLAGAGVARLGRSGIAPLTTEEGLGLFDAAHGTDEALLLPARLDMAALRAQSRDGTLPAVLRSLVPAAPRPAGPSGGTLAARLAAAPAAERDALLTDLVTAEAAAALGHDDAGAVDAERPFKELGMDSLGAVRLRNRLSGATGLTLPSTLVFSHPTVPALVAHLRTLLDERGGPSETAPDPHTDLDRLAALLPSVAAADAGAVAARLRHLLAAFEGRERPGEEGEGLAGATADELFDLIDNDLGVR